MTEVIVITVCLLFNALLSAYEMAFVSFSKPELKKAAKEGRMEARALLHRREAPERTLSILQIGISIVGVLAAAVGGAGASEKIEPFFIYTLGFNELLAEISSIILVVVPLSYATVVLGELVPKTLALRNPAGIVLGGAKWLLLADRVLAPAVSLLEWSTKVLIKTFFPNLKRTVAREVSVELTALTPLHRQYVLNLARIENKKIIDMTVPWEDVNFIDTADSLEEVAHMILRSGHTRLPVVNERQEIIGILHTKEFMAYKEAGGLDWTSIVRKVLSIQSDGSALNALRLMQDKKSHLATVYSKENVLLGIITLEDIIEEIVGDISDEDDDGRTRKILASRATMRDYREIS